MIKILFYSLVALIAFLIGCVVTYFFMQYYFIDSLRADLMAQKEQLDTATKRYNKEIARLDTITKMSTSELVDSINAQRQYNRDFHEFTKEISEMKARVQTYSPLMWPVIIIGGLMVCAFCMWMIKAHADDNNLIAFATMTKEQRLKLLSRRSEISISPNNVQKLTGQDDPPQLTRE